MRKFKGKTELAITRETLQELLQAGLVRVSDVYLDFDSVKLYPKRKYCVRLTINGRNTQEDSDE